MCVDNVVREFLINCKIKEYSPRTIKSYRNNLNLCQRYFYGLGLTELETISAAVIREFILDNQERGCKASYINNLLKTLRAFFTYTIEQEYLQCNPMNKVPWCKEKQTLISVFNSSDVSKMLNVYSEKSYMDMRNKTILTLLFDTGIRCFELCSITNDSIHIHSLLHWRRNTYEYRNEIKELGFRWANNKKAWYWHKEEDSCRSRKKLSLDEIKEKYGCTTFETVKQARLTAR